MKARNTKTGEIVTSFSISKEWGTASYIDSTNTLRFSTPFDGEWEIIDESEPVDWSAFRREAAKDFISGMLANVSPAANQWTTPEIVTAAVEIADELIKQLKQE